MDSSKKNKAIIILVLSVILIIVGIFISKDEIMYRYYVSKGDKEIYAWKCAEYYADAVKIKYDDEVIEKLKSQVLNSRDYAISLLDELEGTLKTEDLNELCKSVYEQKAEEAFEEDNTKLCREYLEKAQQYGYNKNNFVYIDELEGVTTTNNSSEYIIADSNTRYLSKSELLSYNKEQLGYIRNEIFARHGYIFKKAKYRNYFYSKSWYIPDPYCPGDERILNSVERANVDLIKSLE